MRDHQNGGSNHYTMVKQRPGSLFLLFPWDKGVSCIASYKSDKQT